MVKPTFLGVDLATGQSYSTALVTKVNGDVLHFLLPKDCPRYLRLVGDTLEGSHDAENFEALRGATRIK